MNSIWFSLLWKEWREHRLIIAVLGVLAVLVPAAFSLRQPSNIIAIVTFCLFTIPAFSMFLGMNIAGREQSAGTIRFLQALPITGRRPAMAQLLWAAASIAVPALLMVGTAALWMQMLPESEAQRAISADQGIYNERAEAAAWYGSRILAPILAGVSVLVWMAAGGVNRSDEVRAGAIGFLLMIGYWALLAIFAYIIDTEGHEPSMRILMAMAPGGILAATNTNSPGMSAAEFWSRNWFVMASAVIAHGALAAWFIGRFGRVVPGRLQPLERETPPTTGSWLAPPMGRPLTAILWKQLRESAPLALMAAGFISIGLLVYWAGQRYEGRGSAVDVLHLATVLWMMIGFMVATVAGVGVFMEDLRPGLHTFWRSRPINVDQWFAVKFVVGLVCTVVTLAIPLLLAATYAALATNRPELSRLMQSDELGGMLAQGLLMQVSFYTAAVAAMVLMRQPIYAVVMTIAGVGLTAALGGWLLDTLDRLFLWDEKAIISAALILFLLTMLTATAIACLALRKDWGWKR